MKAITALFFFCYMAFSYGQTETLNLTTPDGKKSGKWMVYLDKNWEKAKDTATALFYRYTYYDNGNNLYPMGECGGKNYKLEITAGKNQTEKIKLLDGEYKWLDAKGKLSSIHVLKNGEYISCKEFYPSGELNQYFDYTKKWNNEAHTWYVSIYDKKGNVKANYHFRKDKNGKWPKTRD